MRRIFLVSLALLASVALFAQGGGPGKGRMGGHGGLMMGSWTADEMAAIAAELADTRLGDLTGKDLADIGARLDVARQKSSYVMHAAMLSFIVPGAGQFATGNAGAGAAFFLGNLAVLGGGMVGAYYLLPADLRFDKLDYFSAPLSTVKTAWEGHSLSEYLPYLGVMAGTMFVDMHLRMFSAANAAGEAKKAVEAGRVNFEPRVGPGFMGMALRY